jgi:hypothetical protein
MALSNQSDEKFCSFCDPSPIKAIVWCPECDDIFCSECLKHHKSSKLSRNHLTISLEDYKEFPCNQVYNVRTIWENIRGSGCRDRIIVWLTNCICGQFLSPLKLLFECHWWRGVLDTTFVKVCQWVAVGQFFLPPIKRTNWNIDWLV